METQIKNPVDFITDEQFEKLKEFKLINEKIVRNFMIKKKFKQLRAEHVKAYDAMEIMIEEQEHPFSFDTMRAIVNRKHPLDKYLESITITKG